MALNRFSGRAHVLGHAGLSLGSSRGSGGPCWNRAIRFLARATTILIQTPAGVKMLVDRGPQGNLLLSELGLQTPFWDHTLDLVILTHRNSDYLTGLVSVPGRYDVGAVIAHDPLRMLSRSSTTDRQCFLKPQSVSVY